MKLIALALLSATFALANPVPATEEAAPIDFEKRGVGFADGGNINGLGFGGNNFGGLGTGFPPEFFTNNNLFNTAATNNLAFANNDRVRENIDAQHNTALNANTAANTLATNTAVAAVRRHLMELQRRGLDGSSFATGLDGTNGFTGTSPFLNDFALLSLLGFGGSGFNTNANSFSSAGTGGIGGIGGIGGF